MSLIISEKIKLRGKQSGEGEFTRLLKILQESNGYSALFIISDSYSRQKSLGKELNKQLSKPIRLVELKNTVNPIKLLETEASKSQEGEIFYVLGLDVLLGDLDLDLRTQTLSLLEDKLDDFVELNRPLVFAVPTQLVSVLKESAPNFWGWHKGVFLFEEEFENEDLQINFITDQFFNIFGDKKYSRKKELMMLFESLIKEYQSRPADDNLLSYISYLEYVAILFYELGDYKSALNHYYQVREEVEQIGDEFATGVILNNIGKMYQNLGQYQEAKGMYKRALKKCRKSFREKFVYKALILNNIGWINHLLGDDNEALRYCHHALGTIENNFNPYEIKLAPVLNLMGNIYLTLGEDGEALDCFRRVLQICEKNEGLDHPYLALIMHTIGMVYRIQRKLEDALKYFYHWTEKVEKYYGPEHPRLALQIFDMGEVYFEQADYEKALEYFKWALHIREAIGKTDDPDAAKILFYIGKTLHKQQKIEEAKDYLTSVGNILEVKLPPDHPFNRDYQSEIGQIKEEAHSEETN